jgi:hypothetical protein
MTPLSEPWIWLYPLNTGFWPIWSDGKMVEWHGALVSQVTCQPLVCVMGAASLQGPVPILQSQSRLRVFIFFHQHPHVTVFLPEQGILFPSLSWSTSWSTGRSCGQWQESSPQASVQVRAQILQWHWDTTGPRTSWEASYCDFPGDWESWSPLTCGSSDLPTASHLLLLLSWGSTCTVLEPGWQFLALWS